MQPQINLKIVHAEKNQIDILLDYVYQYYTYDEINFQAEIIRPALEELVRDSALGRAWIIQIDNQQAGYAVITVGFDHEFGGRMVWLTDFYLETSFRGRGFGRHVLTLIEEESRKLGALALVLLVEEHNIEAQKLYHKYGFKKQERFPMSKML